jgi:hypothetical protein
MKKYNILQIRTYNININTAKNTPKNTLKILISKLNNINTITLEIESVYYYYPYQRRTTIIFLSIFCILLFMMIINDNNCNYLYFSSIFRLSRTYQL